MPVCLSVRLSGTTGLPLEGRSQNFSIFRKSAQKIQVSLKSDNNNGHFTWRPKYIYDNKLLSSSYNEQWFGQKVWRKSKHMLYVEELFFRKSCHLWDNVGKCCRAGQDTGRNTIQRVRFACRINKQEYRHTLRIFNTCCFSRQQWLCERASVLRYSTLSVSFFPVSLQELPPVRLGISGAILFVFGFVFGEFIFPRVLHSQIVSVSLNPTNAVQ
jgi:hypothetical protein